MDFEAYFESLRGKRVAVLGLGVSNRPLVRLLRERSIETEVRDRQARAALAEAADEAEALGAALVFGEDYLRDIEADVIFRSPGIMPHRLELQAAAARGAALTSETEVFFEVCPCRTIAVTGSDGKTTTATLLYEMLKEAGERVFLGGNIGTPLLDRVPEMEPNDWAVLELSSFQLMTMRRSPAIAVVTNVEPNHLDVHSSMAEYVDAKANIFRHQSAEDRVVLNMDNTTTRDYGVEAVGERVFFSRRQRLEAGAYLENGVICVREWGQIRELFPASEIAIPGQHNVENYLAAIAALSGTVPDGVFLSVARRFRGVEHRIEFVRELGGVRYYNDSIASSPSRTLAGLRAFDRKVILIAGGYDKAIDYAPLAAELSARVKALVLTGATAEKIRAAAEAAGGAPPICMEPEFEGAVRRARSLAEAGDVVLLSPAAASFDMFKNFAERGERFKAIVRAFG